MIIPMVAQESQNNKFSCKLIYKNGASENNFQIEIDENREELFNDYYFENNSEKYDSLSNKQFLFFEKIAENKLKFNFKKKMIYSLSIFGFVIILG